MEKTWNNKTFKIIFSETHGARNKKRWKIKALYRFQEFKYSGKGYFKFKHEKVFLFHKLIRILFMLGKGY